MNNRLDSVCYQVNPAISNDELNRLFFASWPGHQFRDFKPILERSLAFVGAYKADVLVGWINLAWDGGIHAFLLDTTVHPDFRHQGIGQELVRQAVDIARHKGIVWLHVDYEPHLQKFYEGCGFTPTAAGLLNTASAPAD